MRYIIESIYPVQERRLFTDREAELAMLARNSERILDGSGKNICFIGLRRIGKSLILKEYISKEKDKHILPVYISGLHRS
jgi:predicted AAA+ superfamily ATPase